MNPEMMGGPTIEDMEFKADQNESEVQKKQAETEEAKLAKAVDDIFNEKPATSKKITRRTTAESLRASNADIWLEKYFKQADNDPTKTHMIDLEDMEDAAFVANNYLEALKEKAYDPTVKINPANLRTETNMKQFASNIIDEWNREKQRRAKKAKPEKIAA